ncbi:hypothetical protein KI387_012002, partial [Taxus chinensis]
RLSWGNGVGLLACGDISAFNRPEVDSRLLGKKRASSTSNSNHSLQDRHQISTDPLENTRGSKISRLELKDEKRGRLFDIPTALDDFPYAYAATKAKFKLFNSAAIIYAKARFL